MFTLRTTFTFIQQARSRGGGGGSGRGVGRPPPPKKKTRQRSTFQCRNNKYTCRKKHNNLIKQGNMYHRMQHIAFDPPSLLSALTIYGTSTASRSHCHFRFSIWPIFVTFRKLKLLCRKKTHVVWALHQHMTLTLIYAIRSRLHVIISQSFVSNNSSFCSNVLRFTLTSNLSLYLIEQLNTAPVVHII